MTASGNYIVESDVDNWPVAISATEDFETTDVNVSQNKLTVVNNISIGTELRFSSTGVLPAPLETGVVYYAISFDPTHIKIAPTSQCAIGNAIDLTDVGSGTHTLDIGSGSSEADRQAAIDRTEQLIERITQDYFYSKVLEIYRDGNSKDKLFLGLISNILTVTEILISGVELTSSWYTFDINSVYLNPEALPGGGETAELMLRMKYKTKLFPKGMGNIKITGTYGWTACPAAIKQAAIMLCRYENDETLCTKYDDLVSDKLGDMSQSRGQKKFLTGIQEADKLIRNYIRKKPMMGAV